MPLKDQTAPKITEAVLKHWIFIHGTPFYLLTDQRRRSNVDGDIVKSICNKLRIEKRRSSANHSQGNDSAERSIRTMKDLIRAVLLHRQLPQTKWRPILPALLFALNASPSKATKCVPYNVVFGRNAVLPEDIIFKNQMPDQYDNMTPGEYEHATSCSLQDIFFKVVDALKISKLTMQKHYNKNLRFTDYTPGQQVWLKVKHKKPEKTAN